MIIKMSSQQIIVIAANQFSLNNLWDVQEAMILKFTLRISPLF